MNLRCLWAGGPTRCRNDARFVHARHADGLDGGVSADSGRRRRRPDAQSAPPTEGTVNNISQLTQAYLVKYDAQNRPYPELVTVVPTQANGGISRDGKPSRGTCVAACAGPTVHHSTPTMSCSRRGSCSIRPTTKLGAMAGESDREDRRAQQVHGRLSLEDTILSLSSDVFWKRRR